MKVKTMLKYLLIASLFIITIPVAASTDIVGEKQITFSKGEALVTTRKEEEKLGFPYTLELKVSCTKGKANWQKIAISESESVCDVKPQSAKLTADGKNISVMIRETDADAFNEKSQTADANELGNLRPTCKKAAKEFLFSLENYCQ
ncbi:hypothetical protein [Bdellovibrio sp. HCB2-146]|uniref:hypothetical protein n=1 Tax=Bdellovibrio sp. HCB2-146 TaxID=3394362 RepID=UPI0039BCD725